MTFRLDTAAAIRELEDAGIDNRQAAAIVGLQAEVDADLATKADVDSLHTEVRSVRTELKAEIDGVRTELKAEIDGVRTELKAEIDGVRTELKADIGGVKADVDLLREQTQANHRLLEQQMQTGFAEIISTVATNNAEQQRRVNLFLGSLVAIAALILAGLAVL